MQHNSKKRKNDECHNSNDEILDVLDSYPLLYRGLQLSTYLRKNPNIIPGGDTMEDFLLSINKGLIEIFLKFFPDLKFVRHQFYYDTHLVKNDYCTIYRHDDFCQSYLSIDGDNNTIEIMRRNFETFRSDIQSYILRFLEHIEKLTPNVKFTLYISNHFSIEIKMQKINPQSESLKEMECDGA